MSGIDKRPPVVRCCLCSKTLDDVAHMIESERGLFICDECVDVCTMLVAERRIAARAKGSKG